MNDATIKQRINSRHPEYSQIDRLKRELAEAQRVIRELEQIIIAHHEYGTEAKSWANGGMCVICERHGYNQQTHRHDAGEEE